MPNLPELPYNLPESLEGKIVVLSEIVGINPIHFVDVSQEDAMKALIGLILYWHLDKHERPRVIQHWQSLPRPLYGALQSKLDFTQVNRSWGMWSLSTDELIEKKEFLNAYNAAANALGLSLSIKSVADIQNMFRQRSSRNLASIMTLLIIGAQVKLNEWEESRVDDEMANRLRQH